MKNKLWYLLEPSLFGEAAFQNRIQILLLYLSVYPLR